MIKSDSITNYDLHLHLRILVEKPSFYYYDNKSIFCPMLINKYYIII